MEVNIPLLLDHIKKNGFAATVNVSTDTPDPCLIFISGENHEGSRREYVEFTDLNEILVLNNIIGRTSQEPSLVKEQFDLADSTPTNRRTLPERIENLIYDTLAKYIIQILLASRGKLYYPEIIPLQKHKEYFTNR